LIEIYSVNIDIMKKMIILVVLVIVCGGAFSYYHYYVRPYNIQDNGSVILNREISVDECKTTTDPTSIYYCAFNYSIEKKDPSFCSLMDRYPDAPNMMKNECLADYIKEYNDTSLCKTMTPDPGYYYDFACNNHASSSKK